METNVKSDYNRGLLVVTGFAEFGIFHSVHPVATFPVFIFAAWTGFHFIQLSLLSVDLHDVLVDPRNLHFSSTPKDVHELNELVYI